MTAFGFGFDPRVPTADTGEFPGYVNPRDSVVADESVIFVGTTEDTAPDKPVSDKRRGRRRGPDVLQA
ncbi:hypothetical protein AWC11_03355 [Mycobacterium interjectum]|nr:hypothetical protein AWC11_03355 [Mycobacterium interjectum]